MRRSGSLEVELGETVAGVGSDEVHRPGQAHGPLGRRAGRTRRRDLRPQPGDGFLDFRAVHVLERPTCPLLETRFAALQMTPQRIHPVAATRALHPASLVLRVAEWAERVEQSLHCSCGPLVGPGRQRHDLADEVQERQEAAGIDPQLVDGGRG